MEQILSNIPLMTTIILFSVAIIYVLFVDLMIKVFGWFGVFISVVPLFLLVYYILKYKG